MLQVCDTIKLPNEVIHQPKAFPFTASTSISVLHTYEVVNGFALKNQSKLGDYLMYENYEKIIKAKGLTNYKVSKDTGIAQSVLSTWKNGGTTPRVEKLQILADYLGVSVDYLLGVQTDVHHYVDTETAQIAQEIFENPDLRALFDAAEDSRPQDLQMAADMLRRFKQTNE